MPGGRSERIERAIFGDHPARVWLFATPTALAILLDFALRAPSLVIFPPLEWLNYFGSSLASLGFWSGPLWIASRLWLRRTRASRAGLALFAGLFVLPFAAFSFGGQLLYYRVFHYYMGRDTVRLGIRLRGTLGAWLGAWNAPVVGIVALGLVATAVILLAQRRAAPAVARAWPILPVAGWCVAMTCFWVDFVESRSLQAAPPDTCFVHGVVHALRDATTGKGWARRGISQREPDPLPPIPTPAHRPNVLLIVTESVRADALCSEKKTDCASRFLDDVAPDREALGKLTSQSSGTFSSCVMLWTGLGPDADFRTMHHAAVLWDIARAEGYRTAYVGSQNLRYDDFGAFLEHASLDTLVSAVDLGGAPDPHVGAPDENATARLLAFVKGVPADVPYFAVLHLSNTHWPYRVDPALQPFAPHDASPSSPIDQMHNHYRNSVLLQERTVSELLRALEGDPRWADSAVVFLSDHGEQFREHGGLYHLTSLFDEQVRIPGFLVAGDHALDTTQRATIRLWTGRRTYTQDVSATVLDLLGALELRGSLPFASRLTGRSLLRHPPPDDPVVLLSTASGVWQPDDAKFGVMQGEWLAVRSARGPWACYDIARDPEERMARTPEGTCASLADLGKATWPEE